MKPVPGAAAYMGVRMNTMLLARVIGIIVLVAQAQPLVLPALCRVADHEGMGACEHPTQLTQADQVTGSTNEFPCSSPALCGLTPPAAPRPVVAVVATCGEATQGVDSPAELHASEPQAPLPPPPLA